MCKGDYYVKLKRQITDVIRTLHGPRNMRASCGWHLLDCVRRSLSACAQQNRQLEWDPAYFQSLNGHQKNVVRFYRRLNRADAPVQSLKRTAEVYAQDGEMEDGAYLGRQKRRFLTGSLDHGLSLERTGAGRANTLMDGIVFEEDSLTEKLCEMVESMDRMRLGD